jgi:hypothetical protein
MKIFIDDIFTLPFYSVFIQAEEEYDSEDKKKHWE